MAALSGSVANQFGYQGLFAAELLIALVSLIYIYKIFQNKHAA
jgi:hypothetical protein